MNDNASDDDDDSVSKSMPHWADWAEVCGEHNNPDSNKRRRVQREQDNIGSQSMNDNTSANNNVRNVSTRNTSLNATTTTTACPLFRFRPFKGGFVSGPTDFNGLPHGNYIEYLNDEVVFFGKMEHGSPQGQGIQLLPNGSMYTGQFKDGKRHGIGSMTYPNKDVYDGNWINDDRDGIGKYQFHFMDTALSGRWEKNEYVRAETNLREVFMKTNGRFEMWY